ncbi:hypothetical protein FOYG_10805 [Fusarium oxysporum NRRL 32931]|uniref:Uncharacterized protein n=1 Tax=Fusarium oxysporum NRRL 32931 TaxID=660029 RepID=W9HV04_FUSOX|nr:hypothetical protein FOYG_10805 [Fusarium oxysporum NRRL 32931]
MVGVLPSFQKLSLLSRLLRITITSLCINNLCILAAKNTILTLNYRPPLPQTSHLELRDRMQISTITQLSVTDKVHPHGVLLQPLQAAMPSIPCEWSLLRNRNFVK